MLDFIGVAAFVTSLVALPFSLYYFRRKPIRSVLLFGFPMLVAAGAFDTSQRLGQTEVLDTLNAFDREDDVFINGNSVPHANDVLLALKNLRWLPAHHSSPTKTIHVEMRKDSRHVVLSLARDSGNPQEYWVFYPRYYITGRNEIGRIVTPMFDQYSTHRVGFEGRRGQSVTLEAAMSPPVHGVANEIDSGTFSAATSFTIS